MVKRAALANDNDDMLDGRYLLESPVVLFFAVPARAGVMLGPGATVSVRNTDDNFLR